MVAHEQLSGERRYIHHQGQEGLVRANCKLSLKIRVFHAKITFYILHKICSDDSGNVPSPTSVQGLPDNTCLVGTIG